MQRVVAGGAVGKEKAQRLAHGGERDLVPGNFAFVEELHFETFLAGVDVDVEQTRQVEEMHLMHVRHVQQREQALDLDARARFLQRLARGAFARRFVHFHEARGQGPVAVARFDRAPAEQHLVVPDRHRADDVARILIVDGAAVTAHEAFAVVAGRNAQADLVAADGTEFHGKRRGKVSWECITEVGGRVRRAGRIRCHRKCGGLEASACVEGGPLPFVP